MTAVTFLDDKPVYLFLLPRPDGDAWNLLVLTLEGSVDLQQPMKTILKDARYAAWFKGTRMMQEIAAVEQIYSPIIKARSGTMCSSWAMPGHARSLSASAP